MIERLCLDALGLGTLMQGLTPSNVDSSAARDWLLQTYGLKLYDPILWLDIIPSTNGRLSRFTRVRAKRPINLKQLNEHLLASNPSIKNVTFANHGRWTKAWLMPEGQEAVKDSVLQEVGYLIEDVFRGGMGSTA